MGYIESIEQDLDLFKRKALLTEEYKKVLEDWRVRAFNKSSDFIGGPTFEMDRVLSINNNDKTVNYEQKSIETATITCPLNRQIEIVLKHESILDLPIPDVLIKLFEYHSWGRSKNVSSKKTDAEGRAVFTDLTLNESYFAEAIDNNLVENNKKLFQAYDELMLEMYTYLNASWEKYKPEWEKGIDVVELIKKFIKGLFDGFFSVWDDIELAYNVITDPVKYGKMIYEGAAKLCDIIGEIPKIDIKASLEQGKDFALRLAAFFSDESAIYLIANAVLLNIKMYPWGNILPELVSLGGNILGDILRGLIFGALLSLIAGPVGIAYMAYRLASVAKKASGLIKKIWNILQTILSSITNLVKKFFERVAILVHKMKNTLTTKLNSETRAGAKQNTHLALEHKKETSSGRTHNDTASQSTKKCTTTGCPISMVTGVVAQT